MNRAVYILLLFLISCGTKENLEQKSSIDKTIEKDLITTLALSYGNDTLFENYVRNGDTSKYYWNLIDVKDSLFENRLDTFVNQWFSHFMHKFELVNLSKKYSGNEIYRIVWLRAFHNPIMIEVSNKDTGPTLNYKISDGEGGYGFGKLIIDTTFTIQDENWDSIQNLILKCGFWNLKTKNDKIMGFDGSDWILEGHHKNGYHMVYRWGGLEITELGRYIIKLSKIKIPEDEFY